MGLGNFFGLGNSASQSSNKTTTDTDNISQGVQYGNAINSGGGAVTLTDQGLVQGTFDFLEKTLNFLGASNANTQKSLEDLADKTETLAQDPAERVIASGLIVAGVVVTALFIFPKVMK